MRGYRAGLSVAAIALLLEILATYSPEGFVPHNLLWPAQDFIAVIGCVGLGISLYLIHIYVTPLKRFVQGLYATGFLGGLGLALTQPQPVTQYVASHPGAVWLVGPLFAAVTGLAFKEGLCYGKAEAAGLFFVTPALMLGHLTGLIPERGQQGLLAAFVVMFTIFAARKYTQAIEDDIGDKSVFELMKLPAEEQQRRLAEMGRGS